MCFDGALAALLRPEDQIDPQVEVLGDVVALERLAVDSDEILDRVRPAKEQTHSTAENAKG